MPEKRPREDEEESKAPFRVQNPNLPTGADHLYHLGLDSGMDLKGMFGDVEAVLMGGTALRMEKMAHDWAARIHHPAMLIGKTERYSLYKTGKTIFVNHNIGQASMSVLLHELAKLMHYTGLRAVPWIRIGTSGGVGIPAGSVVVTSSALNGEMEEVYALPILGKIVKRTAIFDQALVRDLESVKGDLPVVVGKTMSTDCFYEGQGRIDGAICDYELKDQQEFLQKLHGLGVRNIEMESALLASFTHRLGIPATSVCVTLVNRLEGDQIDGETAKKIGSWVELSKELVFRWLELRSSDIEGARSAKRQHVE